MVWHDLTVHRSERIVMPPPKIEDVRPILQDFELRIRKVLEAAWKDWETVPERLRTVVFDTTTRANCIFSCIRDRALAEFHGDPEIHAQKSGRSVKFLFRQAVLVRLKKANRRSKLGSNIPTYATLEFTDPRLPLFDLPEIYYVDVLYHEDKYAKRIEAVEATARQGDQKLWGYFIEGGAASAPVVPITPPPNPGLPPPAVVRPREQDATKESEETDKPPE